MSDTQGKTNPGDNQERVLPAFQVGGDPLMPDGAEYTVSRGEPGSVTTVFNEEKNETTQESQENF